MTHQSSPLREKLKAVASEAMLDAAERCMVRNGYHATTMQQVAAEAGCAIGTFYLYFKSKEELFRGVVDRHARVLFANLRDAIMREQEPVQQMYTGTKQFMAYMDRHRGFFRMFFVAVPVRHRLIMETMGGDAQREYESYLDLEREAIREAQKRGLIRRDVSPERLQQFMGDVCLGLGEEFVSTPKSSAQEYTDLMWSFIGGGIGLGRQENGK
jgi:AcrR family transcriptional regulator